MIIYSPENAKAGVVTDEWFCKLLKVLRAERRYKRKGPDLWLFYGEEHIAYVELERKLDWESYEWPTVCKQCAKKGLKECNHWDKVNFPERKARGLPEGWPEKPVFMVTFNKDGTNALIVEHEIVFTPEHFGERRWTRRGYEHFYEVPKEKVTFGLENIEPYILNRLGIRSGERK